MKTIRSETLDRLSAEDKHAQGNPRTNWPPCYVSYSSYRNYVTEHTRLLEIMPFGLSNNKTIRYTGFMEAPT